MATRTIRLLGKAYSTSGDVSLVVNFNNVEVFSGTVATTNSTTPGKTEYTDTSAVCTWTISTDDIGSFPLTIAVSNGDFAFFNLEGNYVGYTPEQAEDGTWSVVVQPVDTWGEMNTNDANSDGKDNVSFTSYDGDVPTRTIIESENANGDWVYVIPNGSTLSCDFRIEAEHTTLGPV